jgi:TetR/AcrR family transcriptional repressor of nem operon
MLEMGRSSKADAAKHREQVVVATSKLLRERGAAGASVQEVMGTVGMTPGGFYKHFSSKEALMGLAATAAFEEMVARLTRAIESFPDRAEARSALLQDYLSPEHRDVPGTGCPSAALASDAARAPAGSPLRAAYAEGVADSLNLIAAFADAEELGEVEVYRRAITHLATMVGALTLARGIGRTPLSDDILRVVQESLDAGW